MPSSLLTIQRCICIAHRSPCVFDPICLVACQNIFGIGGEVEFILPACYSGGHETAHVQGGTLVLFSLLTVLIPDMEFHEGGQRDDESFHQLTRNADVQRVLEGMPGVPEESAFCAPECVRQLTRLGGSWVLSGGGPVWRFCGALENPAELVSVRVLRLYLLKSILEWDLLMSDMANEFTTEYHVHVSIVCPYSKSKKMGLSWLTCLKCGWCCAGGHGPVSHHQTVHQLES